MRLVYLFFPLALFCAQPLSRLGFDRKMSPHSAGDDLITLCRGISRGQDQLFGQTDGFWMRYAEVLAIYLPLVNWTTVVQHEIFGHGWRIRSLGKDVAKVTSYKICTPFPYSKYIKAGSTWYLPSPNITTDQALSISIAGLESEIILARKLKKEWVATNTLERRLSLLYDSAVTSFTAYALSLHTHNHHSHDVANYIAQLNTIYPSNPINRHHVRWQSLFNLFDPMLWFAWMQNSYYITTGKDLALPMLRTKGIKWLPSYRTDLTPFGLENRFEAYMLVNDKLLYLYGNFAKRASQTAFGCGFDRHGLFKFRKTSFDVECDLWKQPKMALDLGTERSGGCLWGVRALLTMNVTLEPWIWYEQFGFKTKGYYPGESLKAALIGRFGVAARF